MIGVVINDKYQIKQPLAESTVFELYKCIEAQTGAEVALKMLREDLAKNEERVKIFSSEVQIFSRLSHPAIAQVLDFDLWQGRPFVVTELVDGEELRYWIKRRNIPFLDAIKTVKEIGEVIYHAFEMDVSPRIVKQSNILRTPQGKIRILSFSLPRLKLVGKQESDVKTGIQSDLFFLGTTLFEILTGESPIRKRGGIYEMWDDNLKRALRIEYPELEPQTIETIVSIVDKTFTREVSKRYQDHLSFFGDLTNLEKSYKKNENNISKKTIVKPSPATAAEVVDAIHGRISTEKTEQEELKILDLPSKKNLNKNPLETSPATTTIANKLGLALATEPLNDPITTNSVEKKFKVIEGGKSSAKSSSSIWKAAEDHPFYRNPLFLMSSALVIMIALILFW